jgi:hypothetical protein
VHKGVLFSHKKEQNYVISREVDGTGDHNVKGNKPDSEWQVPCVFSHMWNLETIKGT